MTDSRLPVDQMSSCAGVCPAGTRLCMLPKDPWAPVLGPKPQSSHETRLMGSPEGTAGEGCGTSKLFLLLLVLLAVLGSKGSAQVVKGGLLILQEKLLLILMGLGVLLTVLGPLWLKLKLPGRLMAPAGLRKGVSRGSSNAMSRGGGACRVAMQCRQLSRSVSARLAHHCCASCLLRHAQ